MKKIVTLITSALLFTGFSLSAFAITCPQLTEIKQVNGNWILPENWSLNRGPNAGPDSQVSAFVSAEWQAAGPGGSINACNYKLEGKQVYSELSISPALFVKADHRENWTGSPIAICTKGLYECSFTSIF